MILNLMKHQLFKSLRKTRYGGMRLTTPLNDRYHFFGREAGHYADISLHDWKALSRLSAGGDIGLAETYSEGLWDTSNLTELLMFGLENEAIFEQYIHGSTLSRMGERVRYFTRRNTVENSRRNIQAHYDLGNDFYRLWLDRSMTYSSGIFHANDETLEASQTNKNTRITDLFGGKSGTLLEVGCGWGGFAEHATRVGDFAAKGITLSQQQYEFAKARLNGNANIALEDYRHQEGLYDYLVSIEMFEAVGEKYWPVYFEKMKSLMQPDGKAIIQTITIDESRFESYRNGSDMIRTFIFPGGMLPSGERFEKAAKAAGLKVADRYEFGQDYAITLERWLKRFDAKTEEIKTLGYDDRFIRLWRFYLAACIAGFRMNHTNVMQVELRHA